MFSRAAALFLFKRQRADRFSFDVEILFIASKAGIPAREIAINWTNIPGSKVNLVVDSLRMLQDVFRFRVRHRSVSPEQFREFCDSMHNNSERSSGVPTAT
jgi:dolichyl-phosphate beta-glucosyltransferase